MVRNCPVAIFSRNGGQLVQKWADDFTPRGIVPLRTKP
jgi:hypothetical protein